MARTEGQWQKGISFISPSEDVPVLLKNTYLNFGGVSIGESGYGIRDNAGTIEVKSSGGSWSTISTGGGEANTAANLGAGEGIYASKTGVALNFKSLVAGTGMGLTSDGNTITLTATSGSGDVVGPASSVADRIAVFNGLTGKLLKDGGKTLAEVLNTDNHTDGTTNKVFTATEKTKLGTVETNADVTDAVNVGSSIHGATAKTTPVDADTMPLIDSAASNVLKKVTWANIKATIKAYTDTLYNLYVHPNHSGDVTSTGDGATVIANDAVTYAKMQNVSATSRVLGRITAGAGDVEELTGANIRTIANVADGATANSADATLLARANHTGTQTASTISDFDTAVAANSAVTANTAKVTNATHTGEVTGSGALTVDKTAITNRTTATPVAGDFILFSDTSDSGNLKKLDVDDVLGGGGGTPNAHYIYVAATDATTREKAAADYQCDGTADEVQINLAIDDVRATGGQVVLSSGNFTIAASIDMDGEGAEDGDNPAVHLIGSGIDSTFLNGASNIDVIETGQRAKFELAHFTISLAGSGDGIHQTAGTERGNWQSHAHDIFIKSNFTDHTGWGIDMQSPFRMRFTNIEMNGVANGMNLQAHTDSFNPGNISIDRVFIDLWNDASNASAIGLKLAVTNSSSTGIMNLVTVNRLDIYGGNNLTSSIGISIVGSTSSYGDARHLSFNNLNIEDVQTAIKHVRGRDCTYTDLNYIRVLASGTVIDLDSNSHNNFFENLYAVGQSSSTFNLIVDANSSANLPNSLKRVDGYQPSTVTINATLAANTILEHVDLSGGSPTIDSDITNRNNVRTFSGIELGHATDTTISRDSAGVIAVEGVVIPSISSTNTLTNKRVTPRVSSETSSATPTINVDNVDAHSITALATAITSMTTNLSGTPTNFQKLIIRIKDNGTARAITWGASFEAKGVALPTTTVISKVLTVGFIYDTVTSKWGCVASVSEA